MFHKFIFHYIIALYIAFATFQCSSSMYYEIRSQFLKPVKYTGGLCRVSDETQVKLLTQNLSTGNPAFVNKISKILAKQAAYFSVSLYDGQSGYTIRLNQDTLFHAASSYKTAILMAVMRMDQRRQLSINEKIYVKNQFESIVDGSSYALEDDKSEPDVTFSKIGEQVFVLDLLKVMIEKSSNLATNILLKYAGIDNINNALKEMGSGIVVARGVSDDKAYADCINNLVSARELEILYRLAYDDKIDAAHRKTILEILEKSSDSDRLPGKLPEGVKVAHKPGNTSKVFHDAGIVIPKSGSPYFIAILTSQYKSEKKMSKAIADVSLLIYDEIIKARISPESKSPP
jgi:beta-lactamase class A